MYSASVFQLSGTGARATLYPDGRLALEITDKVSPQNPCFLSTDKRVNALIRLQKNVQTMQLSCEIWNYDGTGYQNDVMKITALQPRTSGSGAIGGGVRAALGFLRVATTLIPVGGRPPTTADAGNWTELKFDGNLRDSSGHNHGGSGGTYVPTPNQITVAYPRTAGAPSWSPWTSLRAGFPAQLDGSASYSLADGSSAVSFLWQQTKGPSTVIWEGQNTAKPTLQGLIFGTYGFSLKVVDVAGNSSTATLEVGAVATDDNGVVVNADPNVDRIFGPMIAFGRNPWGFADERAMTATKLRMAAYNAQGLNPPSWTRPGPGTVTYRYNGTGLYGAPAKTTRAIGPDDMSIAIQDASSLDFSSLPTRLLLGNNAREEVRICSVSATTGPATLTVCYDGRGHIPPGPDSYRANAHDWPAGTSVGQMKVTGTGTKFISVICPVGPGPSGTAAYATGRVQLTPGLPAAVGAGTTWRAANGAVPGNVLRISATHGGAPFVFLAYIASVADPAHLTLSRPYPKDADAGSFTYSIIWADVRQVTLHYARPDGQDAQTYFQTSGCESDTALYLFMGHDNGYNGTLQSAKKYSYMDSYGYTSAFGANFYGEDLAHRALYYRSGWDPALKAARVFGDNYVDSPQVAGGDVGAMTLLIGGGVVGGFAAAILDTSDPNRPSWGSLRGLARTGSIGAAGCNDYDTRDSGYLGMWLTLAAGFDPDPAQRTGWQNRLRQLLDRDERCKGPDNSWANGFLWNGGSVPLTMTKGSAVVTGSGIPQGICYGVASGTMEVTKGSATATGAGFVAGRKIVITGTRNGAPYTGLFEFAINPPGGSITMAALWPGDSGRATWMIENNDFLTTIGTSNNDPQLTRNWACIWNSPSQITLDRPWDGTTEKGAHIYSYTLAGFGQQPFMLGIRVTQMKLASQIPGLQFAARYATLAKDAATWIHDFGYDKVTQGLHYGRIMQACEPDTVPPPSPAFNTRTPGCNNGLTPSAVRTSRVLTAEASQALRVYYEANPTPEARAWGDIAYGSIWGNPVYTTGGVYSDANYVRDENSDISLGAYKWTGFFFGMGMAHQWPAVRLGGVAPPRNRTVSLDVKRGDAAQTRIWVTAPSGAAKSYPCAAASTCQVTVDDRQGSHWYTIQYLSADGKVVSQSAPALITGPQK